MTTFHRFRGGTAWRQLMKLNQVNTLGRLEYVLHPTDEKKKSWQLRHHDDGNFHHLIDGACGTSAFFRNMNCQNCQNLLLGHHMISRHSFKITLTSMISTMFIVTSAKQSKNFFVMRSTIFGNGWCYLRTLCPSQSRPKSTPTRKTATCTVAAIQAKEPRISSHDLLR